MTDTKHTPGPWTNNDGVITDAEERRLCLVAPDGIALDEQDAANARRIVACVNACDGIGTETLEHCKFEGDWNAAKQRDELLAALRHITDIAEVSFNQDDNILSFERQAIDTARAAISKATPVEIVSGPSISESEDARRNA